MTHEEANRINERLAILERENKAMRRQIHESTQILNGLSENMATVLAKLQPKSGTEILAALPASETAFLDATEQQHTQATRQVFRSHR